MTTAPQSTSICSFPRLHIDNTEALLSWLISMIEDAPQDRLQEIHRELFLIDGTSDQPSVTFSRKTEPKVQIAEGRLFFEFGSEEHVIKEGLSAILSLLSTEDRDKLTEAIIRTNRAKAIKG